jgi:zinc D-Ala-D-Ala dipeptidase
MTAPVTACLALSLTLFHCGQKRPGTEISIETHAPAMQVIKFDAAPADAESAVLDTDFIDISVVVADAVIDMRYATAENFVHRKMYPVNRCLLRRQVAMHLVHAADILRPQQRRLLLWDCYRPASVQREFWRVVPDTRYVAQPTFSEAGAPLTGSKHSRGAAVDISLADSQGRQIVMPTAHDDFSAAAQRVNAQKSKAARELRILDDAMQQAGFTGIATEWWHYDHTGANEYPLADQPLQ